MPLNIDKKEIDRKNKIIDDAILQLKKEFVGIDEQIDSIMDNLRVWFLYPQLQSRPCVINIFGMTGCGKTSLVRRIAELIEQEKNLVYFNFCAINEMESWQIEDEIEDNISNECSNRIFVFDEFQYAATIGADGMEKDNRNGLKPFWELLDTGVLHKRLLNSRSRRIARILAYISRINAVCPMEIVDGKWINAEECLAPFNGFEKKEISKLLKSQNAPNIKLRVQITEDDDLDQKSPVQCSEEVLENFFLNSYDVEEIANLYSRYCNNIVEDSDIYLKFRKMTVYEICEWLESLYKKMQCGYDLKFNNSIIFVIANIDEAFDVAFNVNPDMSPDQFYKITKKISIVDVKKALQKRFRNEQIARFGNIYVIYPSFASRSFRRLIDTQLEKYRNDAKQLCGLDVEFDAAIKKAIFDEAVYPTQGTRPVFSTIHEMVKTKLPYIIRNICDNNKEQNAALIRYGYNRKKCVISVLDECHNVIDTYEFSDNLRLKGLREVAKDEQQANTAVHESGHFVVYSYLNGKIPEKIISRSAEKEVGGFMMRSVADNEKSVGSRIEFMNEIKVSLGGYVAEGLIFGDDRRSAGASSDLSNATQIASKMVRKWGLCDIPYITTHLMDPNNEGMYVKEDNQDYINDKIKRIIETCLKETEEIINKSHILEMLKRSSKYLLTHSQMPKHVMQALLKEAQEKGDICRNNETYYRDIVSNF